jgi:hypothetical protein
MRLGCQKRDVTQRSVRVTRNGLKSSVYNDTSITITKDTVGWRLNHKHGNPRMEMRACKSCKAGTAIPMAGTEVFNHANS